MNQKKVQFLTLFAGVFLTYTSANAQNACSFPQATADLTANNIEARIAVAGDLFNKNDAAGFFYTPNSNQPATIFTSGLWMGGADDAGNVRLSAMSYRQGNKTEYAAGPLVPGAPVPDPAACTDWNKVFKVTKSRILAFSADLSTLAANPQAAISQYPDIMGWPGMDNPHFEAVHGFSLPQNIGLAPFVDVDADGKYNPLSGDQPAVLLQGKNPFIPAQILWCVFNDGSADHQISGGAAIRMEVQLTAWALGPENNVPFNNTIFTSHKFIHRGVENLNDFRVAFFTDFDLGCYQDDYIGCNPDKNYFFAYNQDAVDGSPGNNCTFGIPTFGAETPVQTATFLNRSMDNFIYMNNGSTGSNPIGTTDPNTVLEYFNYLRGRWRDGAPLVFGGSGYNPTGTATNYAFPDAPSDPNGWSMCTANLNFGDQRTVASSAIGLLEPGAVNELTMAWTLHPNVPGPCPNLDAVNNNVDIIQNAYDNSFTGLTPVVSAHNAAAWVQVAPNPARTAVTLSYGELNVGTVRCFDMQGRLVYDNHTPAAGQQTIPVHLWAAGTYVAQLTTDQGLVPVRFVVE
jgi:hypothetical protein